MQQGLRKRKTQSMLDLHRKKPSGLKVEDNKLDGLGKEHKRKKERNTRGEETKD